MTPIDKARKYIAAIPGAVSGQSGHAQTFSVATALAHGLNLPEADAWRLLLEYNATCQPPWSEAELRHKLQSAMTTPHDKPRGHLLNGKHSAGQHARPAPPAPPAPKAPKYDLTDSKLPDEMPDGARALLRAVFRPGEGIRIAKAVLNDDGKEIPEGAGLCISREEWLKKFDAKNGDANGIWYDPKKTGVYIGLNPMKLGGSRDADVASFRHALVEFDEDLSPEEQFKLYQESKLPCAAIIYSGGKSVHAWVKIDAADRREYDERIKLLHGHFEQAGYRMDPKNRNPSRFSRLPNCVRFGNRQKLLALNTGEKTFSDWVILTQEDGLGECLKIKTLMDLDTDKDPSCVIGFREGKTLRYLCRGKSAWLIGPSGQGKSSLTTEFAIG